jgi:hypothetical protein
LDTALASSAVPTCCRYGGAPQARIVSLIRPVGTGFLYLFPILGGVSSAGETHPPSLSLYFGVDEEI